MRMALCTLSLALCLLLPALSQQHWTPFLGERITVDGTAVNAKLGAMVQLKNLTIFVDGLEGWPSDWPAGTRVRVTGVVISRDDMPVVDPKGPISAGVEGSPTRFLLSRPEWERL